jgi:hypothetical protein
MNRAAWFSLAALAALSLTAHAQTAPSPKLELVSHLRLPGPGAQITVHKNVAYIGGWYDSPVGTKLIDISDPAKPTLIGTLPRRPGVSVESDDIAVISADTPAFKGDLAAVGYQNNTESGPVWGAEFWDVTNPRQPRLLSFLPTETFIHELVLVPRDGRVLALLSSWHGGVRIVDATDPAKPALLSTWELTGQLHLHPGFGQWAHSVNHGVSASADGRTAYVSYWDAGTVILDISDPAKPVYLGRTEPPFGEEGNLRYSAEADGGRILVTTEADVDPTPSALTLNVTAPAALAGRHYALELGFTKPLAATGPVRGEVMALSDEELAKATPSPKGKIALIQPGTEAQWRERAIQAQTAGAIAVLFGGPPPLTPLGMNSYRLTAPDEKITIPGMNVPPPLEEAMRKALAAGQKVEIEMAAGAPQWGLARIWDIRDRTKPVQIATVGTAASRQFPPPGGGSFSVLYAFVRGDRLYLSFGTDGVRVVDIRDPAQPKEIGHFIPPYEPGPPEVHHALPGVLGPWAIAWDMVEQNGLVFVNDLQTGLWIVRDVPR